jgi:hypothetical protein
MMDLLGNGTLDARDMERWEGLALLLAALRTERERARFAALYRRATPGDGEAEEDVAGLLDVAARLWRREEAGSPSPRVARAA